MSGLMFFPSLARIKADQLISRSPPLLLKPLSTANFRRRRRTMGSEAAIVSITGGLPDPHGKRGAAAAAGIISISLPVGDLLKEEGKTHRPGDQTNPIKVDDLQYPSRKEARQTGDRNNPISIDDDDDDDLVSYIILASTAATNSGLIVLDGSDDPKGKRPIRITPSRRRRKTSIPVTPVVEIGESSGSNASWSEPEAYCGVCMESKPCSQCFPIGGCGHSYCADCVSQYVAAKIEDNVTSIGCIDPGCKDGFLEPQMCWSILQPKVFDRWGTALCEAMIMEQMKFYCPYKDCSALLINDNNNGGMTITDSECPHCFRLFCAQCNVPWHAGVSCQEYAELGKDERGREDLMLREVAKKSKWGRCPRCKFYVEKVSGCMFITCRCGFSFCYSCSTEMKTDHFCHKCNR